MEGLGELEPKITSFGSCDGESTSSSTKIMFEDMAAYLD